VKAHSRPDDRRSIVVSLTPKGRRTKQRIAGRMEACEGRICKSLDRESLRRVVYALELLEATL
jgi:DNA-binding MarR family transcriptional regulator